MNDNESEFRIKLIDHYFKAERMEQEIDTAVETEVLVSVASTSKTDLNLENGNGNCVVDGNGDSNGVGSRSIGEMEMEKENDLNFQYEYSADSSSSDDSTLNSNGNNMKRKSLNEDYQGQDIKRIKNKSLDDSSDDMNDDDEENDNFSETSCSEETDPSMNNEAETEEPETEEKGLDNLKVIITRREGKHVEFLQQQRCKNTIKPKCRECKINIFEKKKHICCRFVHFRKLEILSKVKDKDGKIINKFKVVGFSEPSDVRQIDQTIYLPSPPINPPTIDEIELSKFLLYQLGDQLCHLFKEEKEALKLQSGNQRAWKRQVDGVREMCDVCETTIFNYHFTCGHCGFVVCLDCCKSRSDNNMPLINKMMTDLYREERDEYLWMYCTKSNLAPSEKKHSLNDMLLTNIIPEESLAKFSKYMHQTRQEHGIPQTCNCDDEKLFPTIKNIFETHQNDATQDFKTSKLFEISKNIQINNVDSSDDEDDDEISVLRSMIGVNKEKTVQHQPQEVPKEEKPLIQNEWIRSLLSIDPKLKHLQIERSVTLTDSTNAYPGVEHKWLNNGRLLRLFNPKCEQNIRIFQEMWKRGQPVLVSKVTEALDEELWTPFAFSRDFGNRKNDLVNCITGCLIKLEKMSTFWDGFTNLSKRMVDKNGVPMLLKLKDWPPTQDFAKLLPTRFKDLMEALPLKEYTTREGILNLASRLPDIIVKPDLGPKMYIAYGSAKNLEKGTTNLHLDISDAVNLLVFVGETEDGDVENEKALIHKAINDSDCDALMLKRVEKGELPGALWHIYRAVDADCIRDFLNRVAEERKMHLEPNSDPIHDQSWYLDYDLRQRLRIEYNVSGYPIIQCMGDAVFIPAGAPHQVRNLNNCIKIAEDFVSPENVHHCIRLTDEFRKLSATHSNKEDKLQIKNILYHAVKDTLSILNYVKE